jgi:hypothetical protein
MFPSNSDIPGKALSVSIPVSPFMAAAARLVIN